ncbi:hypothetical protein SDC9_47736 [bioreactor metagenome]|uniref:Uncharacterized protein n=1 Tax=bioreactor metagenome TaxID=1076179 RepID=A0A644WCD2_9ZZZZ
MVTVVRVSLVSVTCVLSGVTVVGVVSSTASPVSVSVLVTVVSVTVPVPSSVSMVVVVTEGKSFSNVKLSGSASISPNWLPLSPDCVYSTIVVSPSVAARGTVAVTSPSPAEVSSSPSANAREGSPKKRASMTSPIKRDRSASIVFLRFSLPAME